MNMHINKAGKNNTIIKLKNSVRSAADNAARNNQIGRSALPEYITAFNSKAHGQILSIVTCFSIPYSGQKSIKKANAGQIFLPGIYFYFETEARRSSISALIFWYFSP